MCSQSDFTLTQHSVLGQGAVAHSVGSLVGPQVVHGNTCAFVHLLVVKNMMTVTEKHKRGRKNYGYIWYTRQRVEGRKGTEGKKD